MRIIIAGGRDFKDYRRLKLVVEHNVQNLDCIEIICGEAKGADTLGKQLAVSKGWTVHSYPANWERYGKAAGYRRNEEMAKHAEALIAFWDGKSKGTKHMIDSMLLLRKPVVIVFHKVSDYFF